MPKPLSAVKLDPRRASGETILFSAAPSFERFAFVVQAFRRHPGDGAEVRLVKLMRRWDCNLYDKIEERRFNVSPAEASRFFADVSAIEASWSDPDGIGVDGTIIEYRHETATGSRFERPSAQAFGVGAVLSARILALIDGAGGKKLKLTPEWTPVR